MASKKKRPLAIIHGGYPKTASTALQSACWHSKKLLSNAGVLFPGMEKHYQLDLRVAFRKDPQNHISNKFVSGGASGNLASFYQTILDAMAEEIANTKADRVLFSNEAFIGFPPYALKALQDWLTPLVSGFEFHVAVREPVNHSASVCQQLLKSGSTFEKQFKVLPRTSYREDIEKVIAIFGRDAVHVHVYEDWCAHTEGVAGGFLDAINVQEPDVRAGFSGHVVSENTSLSMEGAAILDSLNRQRPLFSKNRPGPYRSIRMELDVLRDIKGDKFKLPKHVAEHVKKKTDKDIKWLKDTFGINTFDGRGKAWLEKVSVPELPSTKTVDSLAIVLSDLINERHVTQVRRKLQVLKRQGDADGLTQVRREFAFFDPDRKFRQ